MKEIKENEAVQQRADAGRITVRTAFVLWLHKKLDGRFKLSFSFPDCYTSVKVKIHLHGSGVKDVRCSSHSLALSFSCRCGKQYKQIFRGLVP